MLPMLRRQTDRLSQETLELNSKSWKGSLWDEAHPPRLLCGQVAFLPRGSSPSRPPGIGKVDIPVLTSRGGHHAAGGALRREGNRCVFPQA